MKYDLPLLIIENYVKINEIANLTIKETFIHEQI
jgi:hypothetical protein